GSAVGARVAGEVIARLIPLRVALALGIGLTRLLGGTRVLLVLGLILGGLIGGVRGLVIRGLRRGVRARALGLASVVGRLLRLLIGRGCPVDGVDLGLEDVAVRAGVGGENEVGVGRLHIGHVQDGAEFGEGGERVHLGRSVVVPLGGVVQGS